MCREPAPAMAVSPVFGTVARVAAVLGLVQGIVWSAASIFGIISSTTCLFTLEDGVTSTNAAFILYVSGRACGQTALQDQYGTLSAAWFLALSCLFLSFNFIWFCCSVWFLVGLYRHKPKQILIELLSWLLVTFCVCILDLAATIRFAVDFDILQRQDSERFYPVAPAVLMTVAARGFVLYVFNVALVIWLCVLGWRIYKETKEDQKQLTQHTSTTSLYQSSSVDDSLRRGMNSYSNEQRVWSTYGGDPRVPMHLPRPVVVRPQQHLVPRVPLPLTPPPKIIPEPDYSPYPVRRPASQQSSMSDRPPLRSALKRPPTRLGRTVL